MPHSFFFFPFFLSKIFCYVIVYEKICFHYYRVRNLPLEKQLVWKGMKIWKWNSIILLSTHFILWIFVFCAKIFLPVLFISINENMTLKVICTRVINKLSEEDVQRIWALCHVSYHTLGPEQTRGNKRVEAAPAVLFSINFVSSLGTKTI